MRNLPSLILPGLPQKLLQEDGIFGAGTEAAVTAFQSFARITTDGVVGPQTWGRLQGVK